MSGFSQDHRNELRAALLSNISSWMPQFPDPQECINYYGESAFPESVTDELLDGEIPDNGLSFGATLAIQQTAIAITLDMMIDAIERHS